MFIDPSKAWLAGSEAWLAIWEAWLTCLEAWLAGWEFWLTSLEVWLAGLEAWLADSWAWLALGGRRTDLPILHDFVSYRGSCPKRSHDKLYVCLSVCPPLCLSVGQSLCLSFCLYVPLIGLIIWIVQIVKLKEEDDGLLICLCAFLSVFLSICLFVSVSVYMPIYKSVFIRRNYHKKELCSCFLSTKTKMLGKMVLFGFSHSRFGVSDGTPVGREW